MKLLKLVKRAGKKTIRTLGKFGSESKSLQIAFQTVANIEKHQSLKLSTKQKKIADDYSVDIFGSKEYAPWLYVYTPCFQGLNWERFTSWVTYLSTDEKTPEIVEK